MKDTTVEHLERLEDQLQALKWTVRLPVPGGRVRRRPDAQSIVTQTAGLLRGRLPSGVDHQRRLRREWERRLARETS